LRSTRGLRRPNSCKATSGRWSASRRATRALAATFFPKTGFARGMELFGKYPSRGGRARIVVEAGDRSLRPLFCKRAAEVRYRSQRIGASLRQCVFCRRRSAYFRLAVAQRPERRLISVSLRRPVVSVGFVIHLNYENPTLSPFDESQRFKIHPLVRNNFVGAKRIAYGASVITSGGWQSAPKLVFSRRGSDWLLGGHCEFCPIKVPITGSCRKS
jgi:hypothetical protein